MAGPGLPVSPPPHAACLEEPDRRPHTEPRCPPARPGPAYHDGIAGPRGQEDVVGVRGDASIAPLDVLRHVLSDGLDARAVAVSPWPGGEGGQLGPGCSREKILSSQWVGPPRPSLGRPPPVLLPGLCVCSPRLWPPHACRMLSALLLASWGKSGLFRRSGWTQRARTWEERLLRPGSGQRAHGKGLRTQGIGLRADRLTGRGRQSSASLTWRRKVMGFCPMACASPMLARMTSVNGFFTPWEDGGGTQNGPSHPRRLRSHVMPAAECCLEGCGGSRAIPGAAPAPAPGRAARWGRGRHTPPS